MKMTELDKELQQMALMDWNKFCDLIGKPALQKAKICLLRKKKKSYAAISRDLKISHKQARLACKCVVE